MPPTHVARRTLRVQFGIEGYIAAEAQSLKINFISHPNIGLCVIFRLKDMRLLRHILCWPVCLFGEFGLFLKSYVYRATIPTSHENHVTIYELTWYHMKRNNR